MLKKICVICLVFPLISSANVYVSEPPSAAVVIKNVSDLKKEINSQSNINVQEIYNQLIAKRKEITDKNLLEIYYVVQSFLQVQLLPNDKKAQPEFDNAKFRKKLDSLLDSISWLYSEHKDEQFSDRVTKLGRLLNPEFFIHLSIPKMSECLDIAHNLKNVVEYSSLGNDLSPEDGPDYFSTSFFLNKEIETAEQIYKQIENLEKQSENFSKNCSTLSKQQLEDIIKKANNFINGLRSAKINIGGKEVTISRNIRKHLKNLASSSIEKLVEQRNKIEY